MKNNREKETIIEKNKRKYTELLLSNFKDLNLRKDEKVKHCIDEGFYQDGWLITNEGRIWSLTDKRWLTPWMNENGYWRIANAYVHQWVCYYFMSDEDKHTLKITEEHNKNCADDDKWHIEVHHKQTIEKIDCINMSDDEKVLACMAVNNKGNLLYQIKKDHTDVHNLMKGKREKVEKKNKETFDVFLSVMLNSGVDEAYVTYDENGKKEYNMTFKLK